MVRLLEKNYHLDYYVLKLNTIKKKYEKNKFIEFIIKVIE